MEMSAVFHREWEALDQSCRDIWHWAISLCCHKKQAVGMREGIATVRSPQVTFLSKLCIRMGSGPGPRQLLVARVSWLPLVRNQNIFQKLFSDLSFPGLVLIQKVIWHRQRIGKSLPRGGRAMNCKWKAIFPNAVRWAGSTDCWEGAHVRAGVEAEQ